MRDATMVFGLGCRFMVESGCFRDMFSRPNATLHNLSSGEKASLKMGKEYVKACYHVALWITAVVCFATYAYITNGTDEVTFGPVLDYVSTRYNFKPLIPELFFGLILTGITALLKVNSVGKVCREEFMSLVYTYLSVLCASMLFFCLYFYMHSQIAQMLNGIYVAILGYVTLFLAVVPFGYWINR